MFGFSGSALVLGRENLFLFFLMGVVNELVMFWELGFFFDILGLLLSK